MFLPQKAASQQVDAAQQGGLTGAGGTHDGHHFALIDGEIYIFQNVVLALVHNIGLAQVFYFENLHIVTLSYSMLAVSEELIFLVYSAVKNALRAVVARIRPGKTRNISMGLIR